MSIARGRRKLQLEYGVFARHFVIFGAGSLTRTSDV